MNPELKSSKFQEIQAKLSRNRVAGTLLALCALSACSTGKEPKQASADRESIGRVVNAWPIGGEWRYGAPWASTTDLSSAEYRLWQNGIAVCMADKGFRYVPVVYIDSDDIYSILNPLNADWLSYGYHERPEPEPDTSDNDSQPPEFFEAGSGCADLASAFIDDTPVSLAIATRLDAMIPDVDRAMAGYEATSDGRAGMAEWSKCMQERGHDFASPEAAQQQFGSDSDVSDEEIAVRKADYECDKIAKLTESRSKFEAAAYASWAELNAEAIKELMDLEDKAMNEVAMLTTKLNAEGMDALTPPGSVPPVSSESTVAPPS